MTNYPTIPFIFERLNSLGFSHCEISRQTGILARTIDYIAKNNTANYNNWTILINLCKQYFPADDWTYPPLEKIVLQLRRTNIAKVARKAGIPYSTLHAIVYKNVCPSFFTYADIVDKLSAIGFEFQKDGEQSHGTDI